MFKKQLSSGVRAMRLDTSVAALDKLCVFHEILKEYNSHTNLTAVREDGEAVTRLYLDSLSILKYDFLQPHAKVIDVGSGAGFPGLPLAIMRGDINFLLLDSQRKRVDFINHAISKLEIGNAAALHARAENAARDAALRESFDVALSRAVAPLPALMELLLPFAARGGKAVAYKGPGIDEEMQSAARAISVLGGGNARIYPAFIPDTDWKHNFAVVDKLSQTPDKYPRRAGEPARQPL